MSLKLVAEVVPLPVNDIRDIAATARAFADALEKGEIPSPAFVTVIMTDGDELHTLHWGECPNWHEAAGILEAAKFQLLQSTMGEPE